MQLALPEILIPTTFCNVYLAISLICYYLGLNFLMHFLGRWLPTQKRFPPGYITRLFNKDAWWMLLLVWGIPDHPSPSRSTSNLTLKTILLIYIVIWLDKYSFSVWMCPPSNITSETRAFFSKDMKGHKTQEAKRSW